MKIQSPNKLLQEANIQTEFIASTEIEKAEFLYNRASTPTILGWRYILIWLTILFGWAISCETGYIIESFFTWWLISIYASTKVFNQAKDINQRIDDYNNFMKKLIIFGDIFPKEWRP